MLEPKSLSQILPYFHNLGLEVLDERPFEIETADHRDFFLYDLGPEVPGRGGPAGHRASCWRIPSGPPCPAPWNRTASTGWCCARACTGARSSSCGPTPSTCGRWATPTPSDSWRTPCWPTRTSPAGSAPCSRPASTPRWPRLSGRSGRRRSAPELAAAIEQVATLDADRVLRTFTNLIEATLRTNYYQNKPHLSFKLDPAAHRGPAVPAARCSKSGSTRPGSRACTCASARWPAAGCAGPTGARTSARKSSAWSRRRPSRTP